MTDVCACVPLSAGFNVVIVRSCVGNAAHGAPEAGHGMVAEGDIILKEMGRLMSSLCVGLCLRFNLSLNFYFYGFLQFFHIGHRLLEGQQLPLEPGVPMCLCEHSLVWCIPQQIEAHIQQM